jgi:hypothetical protein
VRARQARQDHFEPVPTLGPTKRDTKVRIFAHQRTASFPQPPTGEGNHFICLNVTYGLEGETTSASAHSGSRRHFETAIRNEQAPFRLSPQWEGDHFIYLKIIDGLESEPTSDSLAAHIKVDEQMVPCLARLLGHIACVTIVLQAPARNR